MPIYASIMKNWDFLEFRKGVCLVRVFGPENERAGGRNKKQTERKTTRVSSVFLGLGINQKRKIAGSRKQRANFRLRT